MKLKTKDIPVETGGLAAEGAFSIKASSTAFSILSSGLYSNKFKAILRELGCNAYDSHIEAGYPEKPFTVHLPTRLNPVLYIRDYGTGLSHEDVMGLYTTYFESTKSNSNDFVGCMGLGSKSPFSYTKNFTITSIKDGWKGVYSAYIGKDGLPCIGQLTSEDTDEENGLTISFAVENRHDWHSFKTEVVDTFKWFKTKPEITGDAVNIADIEYAEKDIIPGVHMKDGNGYYAKSYALMGNVAYPINVPDGENLDDGVRDLLHDNAFHIEFDIGALDIAASREELGYTEQTVAALNDKAEKIMIALEGYVADKLKPAKSKWDRANLASDLIDSNSSLFSEIVERYLEKNKAQFPKGTIKSYSALKVVLGLEEIERFPGMRMTYKQIRKYNNPVQLGQNKPDNEKKKGLKKPTNTPADYRQVYQLNPQNDAIVFNDEKGNVLGRIRAAVADRDDDTFNGIENVIVIQPQNQKVDRKKCQRWVKTRFAGAPIMLASNLPVVVGTGTSGGIGNTSITVQKFESKPSRSWRGSDGYTFNSLYCKAKDIPPTIEKGKKKIWLYVPLTHKSILQPNPKSVNDNTWKATDFRNIIKNGDVARMAGVNMDVVYGLNKASIKTVTADKRWVNFFDYLRKQYDAVDWKNARKEAMQRLIKSEFSDESFDPHTHHHKALRKLAKNNRKPSGRLLNAFFDWKDSIPKTAKKDPIKYDRVIICMGALYETIDFSKSNSKLSVTAVGDKYDKLFAAYKKRYPMIEYVSLDRYSNHRQTGVNQWADVIEYIKLVDKA
ncbi:MAG: hypothetical protein ACTSPB_18840 [Candidatus Thorarchaeota archaeon]